MTRYRWFLPILNILLVLLMSTGALVTPAWAAKADFAIGLKFQYATLNRTLKVNGVGLETVNTDPAWMQGVVLNGTYRRFFLAAGFLTTNFIELEASQSQPGQRSSGKRVNVEVTEFNFAVGYTVFQGVSPYVVYWRQKQQTDRDCESCIGLMELSSLGVGLMMNHPLPESRWTAYINGALIQGISLEAGLSYAGIRMPVVGVLGYAYRRIDYDPGEADCSSLGRVCFRDSDILRGPVMMIYFIF